MAGPPPSRPTALRVAALQLGSVAGDVDGNLARATPHVESAAASGAELILLPELCICGYVYAERTWLSAERLDGGRTVGWLRATAARLRVHIGLTFLEARGEHFFNTFALACPDGFLAGVVRKTCAPAFEALYAAPGVPSGPGTHVLACPLLGGGGGGGGGGGLRVAVGICYECHQDYVAQMAASERADILLMPFCAPRLDADLMPGPIRRAYDADLLQLPVRYARALAIPVVFANQCGPWTSPFPGACGVLTLRAGFAGGSCVVDAGGGVLARGGTDEAATLVADVAVPPAGAAEEAARRSLLPPTRWRAFSPLSALPAPLRALFALDAAAGGLCYRTNARRRRAALAASGGGGADGGGAPPAALPPFATPGAVAAGAAMAAAAVAAAAAAAWRAARR